MRFVLFLALFIIFCLETKAQCVDVIVADSSFEQNTFNDYSCCGANFWARDDGCSLSTLDPYHGDSCCCSNGGGAYQSVRVDSQTTYYVSFYVRNGVSDVLGVSVRLNGGSSIPINPPSDNWEFISLSINSGSDTTMQIWFYSGGACFDLFRMTCNPLQNTPIVSLLKPTIFNLDRTSSSTVFKASSPVDGQLVVSDLVGRVIYQTKLSNSFVEFGDEFTTGIYVVSFLQSSGEQWSQKIIKTQ